MDNFNDIKQIWLTAKVDSLPKASKVVKTIKRFHIKHILKSGILIIVAILLGAIMVWVMFDYKSKLLVTRIGEILIILPIYIILYINFSSLKRLPNWKNCSNDQFILFLKNEQIKLISFHKRVQSIGFALVSIGLLLYLFEFACQKIILMVATYSLAFIWLAICWFIIRPFMIRRKIKKLNETIERLENLSTQLLNE
jgi:hypothetical protein